MENLLADIAENPLGAVLVLVGIGGSIGLLVRELFGIGYMPWSRHRRVHKTPMPRADLIGHAMNRTKYGRR